MSHGAEAKGASDVASSLAVAGLMPPSDEATLPSLVSGASKCFLNPVRFFVSWHGVLTLVYR